MIAITLKPALLERAKEGQKTATLRRGIRKYTLGPAVLSDGLFRLPVHIWEIRQTSFEDLEAKDAWDDGYRTVSELKHALLKVYPDLEASEPLTLVRFQVDCHVLLPGFATGPPK